MAALCAVLALQRPFPDCPWDCPGTSVDRQQYARAAVSRLDLNRPWDQVRADLLAACGLRRDRSTEHCFNDWNHVDCCAMAASNTHRTNEDSLVEGMHPVNMLGPHIAAGSRPEAGPGGSWCTCHLQTPFDVCHKQFGASTAFKLVWCEGSTVAAIVDDSGNLLNYGEPVAEGSPERGLPSMGGARARQGDWEVLQRSSNATMAVRWRESCARALELHASREGALLAEAGRHDEL